MNIQAKKGELRKITGVGVMFLIVALFLSAFNSDISSGRKLLFASDEQEANEVSPQKIDDNIEAVVVTDNDTTEQAKFSAIFNEDDSVDKYIVIPKPDSKEREAAISENYVYHTIYLDIEGDLLDFYHPEMIRRVAGENVYRGKPVIESVEPYLMAYLNDKLTVGEEEESAFNEDVVKERKVEKDADPLIHIKKSRVVGALNGTRLALTCNRVYVPELFEDVDNYYISLKRPKDVYKKIVVLDAGHGGRHPGTFSLDGKVVEKDTTLAVMMHLKKLFDENKDIKVYYTRLNDATVYLRSRADLANETEADFFVSIHNNAFFNSRAYGTEVLYNEKLTSSKLKSERLAEIMLEKVTKVLKSRSRGIREASDKYVLGHTNMISALIEIGYLTNEDDLSFILDHKKMKKCAKAIYESILNAYEEMDE